MAGNMLSVLVTTGFGINTYSKDEMCCIDMVEDVLHRLNITKPTPSRSVSIYRLEELCKNSHDLQNPVVIRNGWFDATDYGGKL
jgi:hypothetical protein